MRTWRRLVGAALTDPRKTSIVIAAVATTLVVTVVALVVVLAPPEPSSSSATAQATAGAAPGPHTDGLPASAPVSSPDAATGVGAGVGGVGPAATAPVGDAPVVDRLTALAGRLADGPTSDLSAPLGPDPSSSAGAAGGVGRRYTPDPSGALIRGEFFQVGASGTCYLVTFAADRAWLADGDVTGLQVTGPASAAAARCALLP
jgi:hypothetical protein